jgi:hypothetical protein
MMSKCISCDRCRCDGVRALYLSSLVITQQAGIILQYNVQLLRMGHSQFTVTVEYYTAIH